MKPLHGLLMLGFGLLLFSSLSFGALQDKHQQRKGVAPQVAEEELDLYQVLGLEEEATTKEIKKAYRRLSVQYHPDKNPGDAYAAESFQRVSKAYEVLHKEESRLLYDQGGMELVRQSTQSEQQRGGMQDIFSNFFGGGQVGTGNHGSDTRLSIKIDLADFYNGAEKEVSFSRRIVCRGCSGSKGKRKAKCKGCGQCPNEIQMVQRQMAPGFVVQQQEEVPSKERCRQETKMLEILIEKGLKSGEAIRFRYMNDQEPKQVPGDVYVVMEQNKHPLFQRKGIDLTCTVKLTLKQALTGFRKHLTHLDGHQVVLDSQTLKSSETGSVIKPFEVIQIKGEGMPIHEVPSQFGDLHVTFEVAFPGQLTSEQASTITTLF